MRFVSIALAIACVSCATGPGTPPDSIAGSWSSWGPGHKPTPDGPEIMTLTDSGTAVNGSDSWAGQIRSVSGQYVRPAITLMLLQETMSGDRPILYRGNALDANRIELNGTTFYRQ
jgi:hypothetical protein